MKALFLALTMIACTSAEVEVKYRLHDTVQFRFIGENVFYSRACVNKGKITDFSYFSSYGVQYLVEVKCLTGDRRLWVKQEHILGEFK